MKAIGTKIFNVMRAGTQKFGTRRLKSWLWNREFSEGRWNYLEATNDDCIYAILERYVNGGTILDLGCGSGNTGAELSEHSYSEYTGVDISSVAVELATKRSQRAGRRAKNRYDVGDIVGFEPLAKYDVILFRESLFYVPIGQILPLLRRLDSHLNPNGVFIVRMFDKERCKAIIELLRSNMELLESVEFDHVDTVVLVLR
ncbi:MAG: class I SAM-dependent methyltransferase [Verrucomicrobiae bacterium]|nr:class I SAM-dependent methyltransferase [Verrucomicrobiae bacterium]